MTADLPVVYFFKTLFCFVFQVRLNKDLRGLTQEFYKRDARESPFAHHGGGGGAERSWVISAGDTHTPTLSPPPPPPLSYLC